MRPFLSRVWFCPERTNRWTSAGENRSPSFEANVTSKSNHCTPEGVTLKRGSIRSRFCAVLRSSRSSRVTFHSFCRRGYSRAKKFSTWFWPSNCHRPWPSGPVKPAPASRPRAARSASNARVE